MTDRLAGYLAFCSGCNAADKAFAVVLIGLAVVALVLVAAGIAGGFFR